MQRSTRSPFLQGKALLPVLLLAGPALSQSGGQNRMICGCPDFEAKRDQFLAQPPSDCAYSSNIAGASYDPGFVMEVPVVFHVISNTGGTGDISDQTIHNQVAHMNDSFSGALNVNGIDSMIRFVLASEDPNGQPTTGITRSTNNTWFNDNGNYASSLSWDSNRYLNVFSLRPLGGGGVIGYVPDLPQGGIVGSTDDGVRMLYSAIDSSQFRHVISHEIGHHFGLYHTWGLSGGCQNNDCTTQGDLICDTNPHSFPTQSCGSSSGNCGGQPVPGNNFMNYQSISCVWEFTPGQIRRMRCTLENWRPVLWTTGASIGTSYCNSGPNSGGGPALITATGSTSVGTNDVLLLSSPVPNSFGLFFYGPQQANTPLGNGVRCVGGSLQRLPAQVPASNSASYQLDLNNPGQGAPAIVSGSTWYFQHWFRDVPGGGAQFDLSGGLEIIFTP